MLEVAWLVIWNLLRGVLVTGSCDQDGGIDDQTAQILESLFEAGDIARPKIGAEILGKIGRGELLGWFRAVEGGVDVEGTVGIERAFMSIDLSIF